jgi:D-alanine--poly(phosphoribitol) ligase subunit 2
MRDELLIILKNIREDIDFESEQGLLTNDILDSFDTVALISDLCDCYQIQITLDMLNEENFDSVDRIERMIKECLVNKTAI